MARPEKSKRICDMPKNKQFFCQGPAKCEEPTVITLEEYETVRLIDHVGLTQEQCAEQMDVARTTVQRLYTNARKQIANFIVNGSVLEIEGGNYIVCEDNKFCCQLNCELREFGCSCPHRRPGMETPEGEFHCPQKQDGLARNHTINCQTEEPPAARQSRK